MKLSNYSKSLFQELETYRTVSRLKVTVDDCHDFLTWVDFINNNIPDDCYVYDVNIPHNEVLVTDEIKGLFLPHKLVFNPEKHFSCQNLIQKTSSVKVKDDAGNVSDATPSTLGYSYLDAQRFLVQMYSAMKAKPDFTVKVDDCRCIDNVINYIDRIESASGELISSYNHTSVPIPSKITIYNDNEYSMSEEQYILIMLRNIVKSIYSKVNR
jgi:hypothetical protein